jgi:RNA polymerase sigma-70 factor (ECF subfamily)
LLRVRNPNDVEAWEDFMSIYAAIVRGYCLQRRMQASDVDDITQDVMATVAEKIRSFEYDPAKGRFRAWLGTVTINRIRDWIGRNGKLPSPLLNIDTDEKAAYQDPDSTWVAIFSEQIFRKACQRVRGGFADLTWDSFEATWIRNEAPAQVAKVLGIPIHSVYVNKSRVLKRLEAEVRALAEDLPLPSRSLHDKPSECV